MANISITRKCPRHCSYCFAQDELAHDAIADMPPGTFAAALDFLERSGCPEARLLGGEPTGHPRFAEYVSLAHSRGFRIVVFTGGIVPLPAVEVLQSLPAERVTVVLNTADPDVDPGSLVRLQLQLCRALAGRLMLGVNIVSPHQDPAHLFEWISDYGLRRTLRVGVAHPIWGNGNASFPLRNPGVVPVFERIVGTGASLGIDVGFDCGFTPCMFSRSFVDSHPDLFRSTAASSAAPQGGSHDDSKTPRPKIEAIGVRCGPVVDILPEGDCIACYALSRFRRIPLPAAGAWSDVSKAFDDSLSAALPAGVYPVCMECDYRAQGMCTGGCRARRAQRLRPHAFAGMRADPGVQPRARVLVDAGGPADIEGGSSPC
jgi:hypothetical protein